MPLVHIYLPAGKSDIFKIAVGDVIHDALVTVATAPRDDRFQIFHEMAPGSLIADPHYAGAKRSSDQVLIEIILNSGRTTDVKKKLYAAIADGLHQKVQVRLDDILIALIEVPRENWSFAHGIAQYA